MQKKRMKKGFTLIELLIVVVIVGILALAAIPLITSNTRDARRSEGEQMLGSMKGQARVAFAKLGGAPTSTIDDTYANGGCNVASAELVGQYFSITPAFTATSGTGATITATANAGNASDGSCDHAFVWEGGTGTFVWTP